MMRLQLLSIACAACLITAATSTAEAQRPTRTAPQASSDRPGVIQSAPTYPGSQSDSRGRVYTVDPYSRSDRYQEPVVSPRGRSDGYRVAPGSQSDYYYPIEQYRPRPQPSYPPQRYVDPLSSSDRFIDRPVQRFQLGVRYRNIPEGALITYVAPYSAAHRIGLELDDVIMDIDGIRVGYSNDLGREISYSDGFVTINIINRRDGRTVRRDVDLTR